MKIVLFLFSVIALISFVFSRALNYNHKPKDQQNKKKGNGKKANKKPKDAGKGIFNKVHESKGKNTKKKNF